MSGSVRICRPPRAVARKIVPSEARAFQYRVFQYIVQRNAGGIRYGQRLRTTRSTTAPDGNPNTTITPPPDDAVRFWRSAPSEMTFAKDRR